MDFIVSFFGDTLCYGNVKLKVNGIPGIPKGVTAVIGDNGSGKTTLARVLDKGRYAFGNRLFTAKERMAVKVLTFTDIHSLAGIDVMRYDQRLEASENEFVPTVAEVIGRGDNSERRAQLSEAFNLHDVLDKKVNFLSSGELRKLLIINALVELPDLLILDNPYIGLDVASRKELDTALSTISSQGVSIVLLLSEPAELPAYTDHVVQMANRELVSLAPLSEYKPLAHRKVEPLSLESIPVRQRTFKPCDIAFSITDGHLRYGERTILEDVNWTVKMGESWALSGPNGSGKSLLLSYVCADHPQAYANKIILFDRRRGTGESIWEIKDRIGYVNPEMSIYFKSTKPIEEIIAQGVRPSLERYRKSTPEEAREVDQWLEILGISNLKGRLYSELSSSEQRLVLLCSAVAKQPQLLILDEPFHGMDPSNKQRIKQIVNALIEKNGSSIIFVTHCEDETPQCVTKKFSLTKHS